MGHSVGHGLALRGKRAAYGPYDQQTTQRRVVICTSRRAVVLVAATAFLLAGCSGPAPDAPSSNPDLTTPSAVAGSDLPRFPSIVPIPRGEKTITMPSLEGLSIKQALTVLAKAGWTAGKDNLAPQGVIVDDSEPTDTIRSQQPPNGRTMSEKTAVVVQVGVHK